MRSFVSLLALALTSFRLAAALVAGPDNPENGAAAAKARRGLIEVAKDFFRLQARQEVCVEDDIYRAVKNYSDAQAFCSRYLELEPATAVVEYIPTVIDRSTYTTSTNTVTHIIRTTPVTTVTTTLTTSGAAAGHRFRRGANAADVTHYMRQGGSDNLTATDDPAYSQQLSSACSCLPAVQPSTTTVTYTADPTHVTQLARLNVFQTVNTTLYARAAKTTVTEVYAVASPTSSPGSAVSSSNYTSTGSSSTEALSPAPTPISPTFTCPDEHNMTISQLVDDQLYDFLLRCSTGLSDEDLATYTYSTIDECAAACARADNFFGFAICQAAVYDTTDGSGVPNCILKTSGNDSTVSPGANAVILQRIRIAVTNTTGTSSSSSTFASSASETVNTPSIMSSVFANSSNSMPLITPAPMTSGRIPSNAAVTSYSTFVSDGSTISSGTVYSTYYSSDGVWYYSYYTSYTVAWVATTTIVGSVATTSVSSESSGGENGSSGSGGTGGSSQNSTTSQYGTGSITTKNITSTYSLGGIQYRNQTIIVDTIYPNGQSTQTTTSDIEQVGSEGGSGAGGSSESTISGQDSTSTTTTTTVTEYNTTTVYDTPYHNSTGSGGSGGAGGSGSGNNSTSSTLVYSSQYTTQYASTYSNAGGSSGMGGGANGGSITTSTTPTMSPVNASTPAQNSSALVTESVFSTAYSTAYSTVIYSSGGSGGGGGSESSGAAGGSATQASGQLASNTITPTFTGLPRSGTEVATSIAPFTNLATTALSSGSSEIALSTLHNGTTFVSASTLFPNTSTPLSTGTSYTSSETLTLLTNHTVVSTSYSSGASGFVVSGFIDTSPSSSLNVTGQTTYTGTGLPRSGTYTSSAITAMNTSSYLGVDTLTPSSTEVVPGNTSSFSATFTGAPKSGTEQPSPITSPSSTLPLSGNASTTSIANGSTPVFPTGSGILSPSESLLTSVPKSSSPSFIGQPRSGTTGSLFTPSVNFTSPPWPTTTLSSPSIPMFNSSSGAYAVPSATGTGPSGVWTPVTNPTFIGTIGSPRSSTGGLRSGTYSTATSSVPAEVTNTGYQNETCSMSTMATTTIWSTTVIYGCYSSCPVIGGAGYGGYGGLSGPPHPTGPPA